MATSITPVAKSVFLCDRCVPQARAKVTLEGLFRGISPPRYPYVHPQFCVFAQLVGGLGNVPVFVDVLYAPQRRLVRTTNIQQLVFPNRQVVMQFAQYIIDCPFDQGGMYLIELFCNNVCVGDVPLHLR